MSRRPIATAATALLHMVATPVMSSPAFAGGHISVTLTPKGRGAELISEGLHLYSLAQHRKNHARVRQNGSGNGAGISQHGSANWAEIFQRGHNHSATISQNGNGNAFGIFQFGRRTTTSAAQTGNGNVGLVLQGGW